MLALRLLRWASITQLFFFHRLVKDRVQRARLWVMPSPSFKNKQPCTQVTLFNRRTRQDRESVTSQRRLGCRGLWEVREDGSSSSLKQLYDNMITYGGGSQGPTEAPGPVIFWKRVDFLHHRKQIRPPAGAAQTWQHTESAGPSQHWSGWWFCSDASSHLKCVVFFF